MRALMMSSVMMTITVRTIENCADDDDDATEDRDVASNQRLMVVAGIELERCCSIFLSSLDAECYTC